MRAVQWVWRGLKASLRQAGADRDVEEELAFHVACRTDDLVARGASRPQALRQARLEFGSRGKFADECREARRFTLVEDVWRDLRYAARSLARSRALVAVSLLSLAVGIGANTTLFSAVSAIFLSVPTATRPEELVWISPGNSNQFSYLNYRDLRDSGIFRDLVGYRPIRVSLRADDAAPRSISGMAVTPNFFQGLGVATAQGRIFTADEARVESEPRLAVVSTAFARRQFAGRTAVGSTLILNGEPFSIVGVLPPRYQGVLPLSDPDVYLPLSTRTYTNLARRENENALNVLGRLPANLGRQQAQAAVTTLGANLARSFPQENRGMEQPARLDPFGRMSISGAPLAARIIPPLLAGMCGLILLISCSNVAGLLLARIAGRQREIGLQLALGAPRQRLIRALLSESLVLALLGAGAGMLLTLSLIPALRSIEMPGIGTFSLPARLDGRLVLFAGGLALLTALVCGVIPAVRAARRDLVRLLAQGGHGSTTRLRLRQTLVVVEVSASFVLLVVSLLFLRTMVRLTTIETGFDMEHSIVATVDLIPGRFTRERQLQGLQQITTQLDSTPGLQSSALADLVPMGPDASASFASVDGRDDSRVRTLLNSVGPRYFETLGIAMVRGREFQTTDRTGAAPVAIVTEAFAKAAFPGEDPIGRRVRLGTDTLLDIVGVVRDSSYRFAGDPPTPILYFSYLQRPVSSQARPLRIHVRVTGDPSAAARTVKTVVGQLDANAPVDVVTLREATNFEHQMRRAGSLLFGAMGALGLLLAMTGLYAVISYVVASRTTELGVRMALGASTMTILKEVLGRGLRLTAGGLVLGTIVAAAATQLLRALLAGLSPADPVAFGVSGAILLATGLLASYLPARRALRVDPVAALRHQ